MSTTGNHFLDLLTGSATREESAAEVEWRVVCSGALAPGGAEGDWRTSDVCRGIQVGPFELFITNSPLDTCPQELAVRFSAPMVRVHRGSAAVTSVWDDEIVSDLSSVLSLICRRLISPALKTFQRVGAPGPATSWRASPVIAQRREHTAWAPRPITVVYRNDGVDIKPNTPLPVGVHQDCVTRLFVAITQLPPATALAILRAARSYATALELIERRPDMSYQMLVTSVEAMMNAALQDWLPTPDQQIATRGALISEAKKLGLPEEDRRRLALAACRGERWTAKKFVSYLSRYVDAALTSTPDDLFPFVPPTFIPPREKMTKAFTSIYKARSGATHGSATYPVTAGLGTSPRLPIKAVLDLTPDATGTKRGVVPPVTWFERCVHSAHTRCIASLTGVSDPMTVLVR